MTRLAAIAVCIVTGCTDTGAVRSPDAASDVLVVDAGDDADDARTPEVSFDMTRDAEDSARERNYPIGQCIDHEDCRRTTASGKYRVGNASAVAATR